MCCVPKPCNPSPLRLRSHPEVFGNYFKKCQGMWRWENGALFYVASVSGWIFLSHTHTHSATDVNLYRFRAVMERWQWDFIMRGRTMRTTMDALVSSGSAEMLGSHRSACNMCVKCGCGRDDFTHLNVKCCVGQWVTWLLGSMFGFLQWKHVTRHLLYLLVFFH